MFELGARWGAKPILGPAASGGENLPSVKRPIESLNALSSSSEAQLHQTSGKRFGAVGSVSSKCRVLYAIHSAVKQLSEGIAGPTVAKRSGKEEMGFEESVYWKRQNGSREGPYCPVCYDDNQKVVHLNQGASRGYLRMRRLSA